MLTLSHETERDLVLPSKMVRCLLLLVQQKENEDRIVRREEYASFAELRIHQCGEEALEERHSL